MNADFGLTPELLAFIREEEGWRPDPYLDPVGYPTIGFGFRIPSLDHPSMTLEEGEKLLREKLREYRNDAVRLSPNLKNHERRLAAITDFCYNAGAGNYEKSTLRLMVKREWWKEAGVQMEKWVYGTDQKTGKKVKLGGLVKRRKATAKWLVEG